MNIDHIIWGARDLGRGMEEIAEITGVRPARGGSHRGLGTENALLSLGEGCYLEIIAPDPAQPQVEGLAAKLANLESSRLIGWVIRAEDMDSLASRMRDRGYPLAVVEMSRQKPDGSLLEWRFAHLEGRRYDLLVPGIIEWRGVAHPSHDSPPGCLLRHLVLEATDPDPVSRILAALGTSAGLLPASRDRLVARIDSPRGTVDLV